MKYSFDVIRDAWIPVQFNSGVHNVLSVRDVFKDASNIKCIAEPNVKYSYGIHNFLVALLASAYSITDMDAKFDIMFGDGLDISIFDKYISECESKRPNCFNLFGENPFYQNGYAKYKLDKGKKLSVEDIMKLPLKKPVMIGKIALDYPAGNNSVHFTNDALVGKSLDYVECVKALLSYSFFQAGQDGPNSSNGVNGGMNYPEYLMIGGKNLLHTVLLNTASESIWAKRTGGIAYKGNAAWERNFDSVPKEEVSSVSMVEGLTFQNRFVLLGEPDNFGNISSVYFGPGRAFTTKDKVQSLWVQPNASYVKNKNNLLVPLMMKSSDDLWTDMGDFFKLDSSSNNAEMPLTVMEYLNMCSEYEEMKEVGYSTNMDYNIYYISLDGGKYAPFAQGLYSNYFPMVLLKDEDLLSHFNSCIKASNSVGKALKTSLFVFSKSFDDMKRSKWFKRYNMKFYDTMRMEYVPALLKDICALTDLSYDEQTNKLLDILSEFKLSVKMLATTVYREALLNGVYTGVRKSQSGSKSYMGPYGLINNDIRRLNATINKLLGIEQSGGEDTNE